MSRRRLRPVVLIFALLTALFPAVLAPTGVLRASGYRKACCAGDWRRGSHRDRIPIRTHSVSKSCPRPHAAREPYQDTHGDSGFEYGKLDDVITVTPEDLAGEVDDGPGKRGAADFT